MLERQLSRLLRVALRRAAGTRSVPWALLGVGAFVLRRALRAGKDETARVRVRMGETVTVSVREARDR